MDNQEIMFELLQKIQDNQLEQSEILVKVQSDLQYHIKRTDLLEQQVKLQELEFDKRIGVIEEPFKLATISSKFILKGITILAAIFGIFTGIKNFFHF